MSAFQYLLLAMFVLLAYSTIRAVLRGGIRKRIAVFWMLLWATGAVVSIWPHTTAEMAAVLGIGRGADLLLYCSVLAMLIGFFYIYTRFRRMDRALTLLVRRLAIDNPVLPATRMQVPGSGSDSPAPGRDPKP